MIRTIHFLFLFRSLVPGLLFGLVVSCASTPAPRPSSHLREQKLHEWHDDGGPGKVKIRISLTDQIAEFERGGRPIGWCYVATGKEGHSTADGNYKITEKIVDKYSNKYGWIEDEFGNVVDGDAKAGQKVPPGMIYVPAPMPYWMRLTSYGIGMHGGLIPEPGKPASHGCIRMPKDFVPILFDAVEVGTPVAITHAPATRGGSASAESQMVSSNVMSAPPAAPRPAYGPGPLPPGSRVVGSRPLTTADLRRNGVGAYPSPY